MSWKDIIKGDWRTIVDNAFEDGIQLDTIYRKVTKQLGYKSPSLDKIKAYLDQNYNRHPVWSNVYVEGEAWLGSI